MNQGFGSTILLPPYTMSIFQTALFLHRFEVHQVQRCNRNFTLVQDNSKSLYPPLSWKVLKMLLLLLQKLFPRPRPSFSSGLLSMLWETRNNTLNWLYNSLLCRFHWYLYFLIISSHKKICHTCHYLLDPLIFLWMTTNLVPTIFLPRTSSVLRYNPEMLSVDNNRT